MESTDAKEKPDCGATTDVDDNTQNPNVKTKCPRSIPSNWKKVSFETDPIKANDAMNMTWDLKLV